MRSELDAALIMEKPMTGQPEILRLLPIWGAAICFLAGCQLSPTESKQSPMVVAGPVDTRAIYAAGTWVQLNSSATKQVNPVVAQSSPNPTALPLPRVVEVARATAPAGPTVVPDPTPQQQPEALVSGIPPPDDLKWVAVTSGGTVIPVGLSKLPRLRAPILIREESDSPTMSLTEPLENLPVIPVASETTPSSTLTREPPIRVTAPPSTLFPVVPFPSVPTSQSPAQLPSLPTAALVSNSSGSVPSGPIVLGGQALTFDALAKMVDANGGGASEVGCSSCGDCGPGRPCAPGGQKCEPFPDGNAFTRAAGIIYEIVCCPDPCYQPKWEPIADSSFFVDPARPISNTRFEWDYANHFAYPDRAEYFWAASPKGQAATDGLKAVPYLNYNQLTLVTEIATPGGASSVAIAMPYRSWDAEPFATSAAGFSDMSITAKTLLVDSELFLCSMQMRTYVPIGNVTKGLGDGHVSLEPGLIFGLRLTPDTFLQAEVQEWIPIGGDTNNQGAFLQWGLSINQALWQPVKDVKLIGTLELTGYSFQAGEFTDPVLGPQKLSGQNNMAIGNGYRVFFGKFDVGLAGNFGITGKYMAREEMQFDLRFRY
jgi:hypothetical protein